MIVYKFNEHITLHASKPICRYMLTLDDLLVVNNVKELIAHSFAL